MNPLAWLGVVALSLATGAACAACAPPERTAETDAESQLNTLQAPKCPLVHWNGSDFADKPPRYKVIRLLSNSSQSGQPAIPGVDDRSWAQLPKAPTGSAQALLLLGPGYNDEALQQTCATLAPVGTEVLILAGGVRTWNRLQPFAPDTDLAVASAAHALAQLRVSGSLVTADDSVADEQLSALRVPISNPASAAQRSGPRFHLDRLPDPLDPADFLVSGGLDALLLQARLQSVDSSVRSAPLVRPCHLP